MSGLFVALATGLLSQAQLVETMGTMGSSTETIDVHENNDRFDLVALTYGGTADVRTTLPSNYSGASGGFNVLIQAQETFEMKVLNLSGCSATSTLTFGLYKTTTASDASQLVLEYSVNNGGSYAQIPFTVPTGTGTAIWQKKTVTIPAGMRVANVWLRFRSTVVGNSGTNPQFRIDDLNFTCGSDSPCDSAGVTVAVTGSTVYCSGSGSTTLTASTTLTGPSYQWYDQNGIIGGATSSTLSPTASGSYHVQVTNSNGCSATSGKTNILVYPAPSYCEATAEGCSDDTLEVCFDVQAPDLFFSQYIEGAGFNKYVEIHNATCRDIDMAEYQVRTYHNGACTTGTPTFTIPLVGFLNTGISFVLGHGDGTYPFANQVSDSLQFNGDDAVVLYHVPTGKIVDIIGSICNDPGTAWTAAGGLRTENRNITRKACVFSGITVNPNLPGVNGFATLATEWDTLDLATFEDLGEHSIKAVSYAFAVTSGPAVITSSSDNCVRFVPGVGASTISVNGTFCTFNDCVDQNNVATVTGNRCEARSAKASLATGTITEAAQVFPNPFNNELTIAFSNSVAGKVNITVVDMYGKAVAVVTNQAMEAGSYRFSFDGSNLAAGTYVCRITTAAGQETVRIVKAAK